MQGLTQQTASLFSTPTPTPTATAAPTADALEKATSSASAALLADTRSSTVAHPKRAIRLMTDYYAHPLWEASPGTWGNIDPETLPLSTRLKQDLKTWAEMYDATLDSDDPSNSGFNSVAEGQAFEALRGNLIERLHKELPKEKFEF